MAQRKRQKQDCAGCPNEAPRLLAGNVETVNVWTRVCDQFRMSSLGPVAMDLGAVIEVAKVMDVSPTTDLLDKIRLLGNATIERLMPDNTP